MMLRRTFLIAGAGVAAESLLLQSAAAQTPAANGLMTSRMPGAGALPVIGLGTARRYADPDKDGGLASLKATLAHFVELGGQVIDTAPSYGRAEEVIGELIEELGARDRLFLATKVGVDNRQQGLCGVPSARALELTFLKRL
jgi:aryl-alcohol dehydrogenase-like predicted oxidoreductase